MNEVDEIKQQIVARRKAVSTLMEETKVLTSELHKRVGAAEVLKFIGGLVAAEKGEEPHG